MNTDRITSLEKCTEGSPEWSDVRIDTPLPVDPGTEVEVKCNEKDKLNSGSSTVTCVGGTSFKTTGNQPDCTHNAGRKS
jgi:hypothetical protein